MCIILTSADGTIPSQLEFAAALPKTLVFHGLLFQFVHTLIRAYACACWAFTIDDLLIADEEKGSQLRLTINTIPTVWRQVHVAEFASK